MLIAAPMAGPGHRPGPAASSTTRSPSISSSRSRPRLLSGDFAAPIARCARPGYPRLPARHRAGRSVEGRTPMETLERISTFHRDLTEWRRDIHAHPELGFQEQRTSDSVADKLAGFGIEVHRGLGK